MYSYNNQPLFAESQEDELVQDVEELMMGGILNDSRANSLVSKLNKVLQNLEKGKENSAINQLGALGNQVVSLVDERVLTLEEGQGLLIAARSPPAHDYHLWPILIVIEIAGFR